MDEFVNIIIATVSAHQNWAYALAFILALAEAAPLVGTAVPGSIIIVGIGALVPSGALSLWPLLASATLGAVAGDGMSYWLGHHYRRRLTRVWPFRRLPNLIARGEALVRAHGGKAVFVSRFVQGPRAFVPLAAGILGMVPWRFYAVNVLSALTWAPAHVLAGVLFGASLTLASAIAGRLTIVLLLLLGTCWLIIQAVRYALRRGLPLLVAARSRLWAWASARDSWTSRQVAALIDPARGELKALGILSALLVGAAWVFFGTLEDVVAGDPLVRADSAIYHLLQGLRTAWTDSVMIVMTELGDAAVTVPLVITAFGWFVLRRSWRPAAYWLGAVAFASAFTMVLKLVLHVPRPTGPGSGWAAYAFPSGHATVSVVIYGMLAFLIGREMKPRWRAVLAGAAALMVVLIAFSRVYLGVHWTSDVIGGLAFGSAWVAVLAIAYQHHHPPQIGAAKLLALVCVALLAAGALHVHRHYFVDVERYAVRHETRTVNAAEWWREGWRELPARRFDLKGELEEPLTIQWAGSLELLRLALRKGGWRDPVPWTVASTLSWFVPRPDAALLPVLPKLHDGRPAVLTLIYRNDVGTPAGARLVLRLWQSDVRLATAGPGTYAVWMGSVTRERLLTPFFLMTIVRTEPDADGPRTALAAAMEKANTALVSRRQAGRGWDGRILLGRPRGISIAGRRGLSAESQ